MLIYSSTGILLLCLFVLIFGAFIASLICFLSAKKRKSKKKMIAKIAFIITAVIVLIGIVGVSVFDCYYPRYVGDTETFDISQKENTEEITVLSFNIRYVAMEDLFKEGWYYRASLVKEVIKELRPDIIGFQEVNTVHEHYLKTHLEGYSFLVAYRTEDPFREGMMLAYRSDRFESQSEGYFWLSDTPEKMSKPKEAGTYRIAAYATLKDKITGKTFTAMDTHLDCDGEDIRKDEMKIILDQKQKRNLGEMILMGDMNDEEGSPMYNYATKSGLVDAAVVAGTRYDGPGATWQKYGERLYISRIDFFFLSPSFTVNSYAVFDKTYDGAYPSDHFPIYIKVILGE